MINFGIEKGKLIGLWIQAEAEKQLILRMIAGLETPEQRRVIIDGKW